MKIFAVNFLLIAHLFSCKSSSVNNELLATDPAKLECVKSLATNQTLDSDKAICNENARAVLQNNGDFVIFKKISGGLKPYAIVWYSGSRGSSSSLTMKNDCNLVVQGSSMSVAWTSQTSNANTNCTLALEGTALVIRGQDGNLVWTSLNDASPMENGAKIVDVFELMYDALPYRPNVTIKFKEKISGFSDRKNKVVDAFEVSGPRFLYGVRFANGTKSNLSSQRPEREFHCDTVTRLQNDKWQGDDSVDLGDKKLRVLRDQGSIDRNIFTRHLSFALESTFYEIRCQKSENTRSSLAITYKDLQSSFGEDLVKLIFENI